LALHFQAVPFTLAIFLNAFLLFLLEPLFGKLALPHLGGTAAVWTTCMLFFQIALVAGYLYSHALASLVRPRHRLASLGVTAGASKSRPFEAVSHFARPL